MLLYIVRHAESVGNREQRIQGRFDPPHYGLTPKGKEQAIQEAPYFQSMPIDKVLSSPLQRAKETAQLLFPKQYIIETPLLIEMDMGIFTWQLWKEAILQITQAKHCTSEEAIHTIRTHPSVESDGKKISRCIQFLDHISTTYTDSSAVACVTHGWIITALLHVLRHGENAVELPIDYSIIIENTSIHRAVYKDNKRSLLSTVMPIQHDDDTTSSTHLL